MAGKNDRGLASSPKAGIKALNVSDAPGKSSADDDMEARADSHTLIEASKIKADKGRHGRAKAHIKRQIAHMKSASSEPSDADGIDGPDGDADDNGNAPGNYGNYGV